MRAPPDLELDVHGARVRVHAPTPALGEAVRRFFGPFEVAPSDHPAARLRLELVEAPPPVAEDRARCAEGDGPTGPYTLYRGSSGREARFDGVGGFEVAADAARATLWLGPSRGIEDDALISFCVAELLKPSGVYSLHGAALADEGRGVVLCGASGAGKSTSSLALAAGGFDHLSDDYPFFTCDAAGPRLRAFGAPFKVTARTARFFPELADLAETIPEGQKVGLDPATRLPSRLVSDVPPAVLLFPRIVDAEASVARPLGPSQTLEALLPHALVSFDPALTEAQFQALGTLVAQVDGYALDFGRDVRALPDLVRELLERRGRAARPAQTSGKA